MDMPEALYEGVTGSLVAPFSCLKENKKPSRSADKDSFFPEIDLLSS